VSAILVLVLLLVLSYAGILFGSGRTMRGAGLPSGVEYVALGFVLGPQVFGVLGHGLVTSFEPLVEVALGWIALVIGLDFGRSDDRRVKLGSAALGLLSGALTAGAVAAAVWFYVGHFVHQPSGVDRVLLAGGTGVACAETTRYAIRWVAERHAASGPLTRMLTDFAQTDDLVPLLAMAALFSLAPVTIARVGLTPAAWAGLTIGFGIVLGAMTAVHIGRELRTDRTWGVLTGMSVLGLGVAARLGLSMLTVLFFMGVTTAGLSRHRAALRAMVAPLERPILLPALVLAGAHLDFRATPALPAILAVVLFARMVAKLAFGAALAIPIKSSPLLGAGLLSSGALSISVGLAFAIRFPGPVGDSVLAAACVSCVVGELFGPMALRYVLRGAGEIALAPPETARP
jgi:hypothetical protein